MVHSQASSPDPWSWGEIRSGVRNGMAASLIVCNFEHIDHHIYKDDLSFVYLSAALVNFGFGSFIKKQTNKHKIYHLNSLK